LNKKYCIWRCLEGRNNTKHSDCSRRNDLAFQPLCGLISTRVAALVRAAMASADSAIAAEIESARDMKNAMDQQRVGKS
jgi:hypothetical protein